MPFDPGRNDEADGRGGVEGDEVGRGVDDEEPEERARPSFGGSKKGRGANDSAPVGMFFFLNQMIILYHLLDCRLRII